MPDLPTPAAASPSAPREPTVVRPSATELAVLWTVVPGLGAALAYGLVRVAGWYASLPWAPFQGPARLVDELLADRGTVGTALALALGLAGGLALAAYLYRDVAVVTVGPDAARVVRRSTTWDLARADVTDVFLDRGVLVVLGVCDGVGAGEVAHVATELDAAGLEAAFRAHGWPWRESDPYADDFRRWVSGDDALPTSADAVLRARAAMIEAGKTDDADELRRDLARLGVVVRDDKKVQYWRPAAPPRRDRRPPDVPR